MHAEAHPKAVGSQAYVQFLIFAAYNAVNERGICTCESFMEIVWFFGHHCK